MNWQTDDLLSSAASCEIVEVLSEIFNNPQWERRVERRVPYFGPVSVGLPDGGNTNLSAFVRDLSLGGIGLVHLMPLRTAEVVVTLMLPSGKHVALQTEIVWCHDYGNGWYASGGRLLGLAGHAS